jgi:hypothetical protein
MARKAFPRLSESVRFFVENTLRARRRSPGIERYRPERRSPWPRALAVLMAIGLLALIFRWLALP